LSQQRNLPFMELTVAVQKSSSGECYGSP
jgi:hypothetical protein